MGEIVNLRQYRKRLKRQQAGQDAEVNRLHHGLPKRERHLLDLEHGRRERDLDGKRSERDPPEEEPPTPV